MSSDDPSLVDTETLLASLKRDLAEAQARQREAFGFLEAARVTVHELERREQKRRA